MSILHSKVHYETQLSIHLTCTVSFHLVWMGETYMVSRAATHFSTILLQSLVPFSGAMA